MIEPSRVADESVRRVLVTGATGFLGRALVPRLQAAGYAVTALGLRPRPVPFGVGVDWQTVDLSERAAALAALRPWRWDAVVNLAGPVAKDGASDGQACAMLSAHVNIALNLCLSLPDSWAGRIVHVSSMTVYGHPRWLPVDEAHPRQPRDAYAMAKALSEDVVLATGAAREIDVWVLRLPGLFSEWRRGGALFDFMSAAARGRPVVVSSPEPTAWDVLHVLDAVSAIIRALESNARNAGAVNVGYGSRVDLRSVARHVAGLVNPPVRVENAGAADHPLFQMAIAKAQVLMGWAPPLLEERLAALWADFSVGAPSA